MPSPKLILASGSPRRRELLAAARYKFEVMPPSDDAEDGPQPGEPPVELVARLAAAKAADVVSRLRQQDTDDDCLVLACDTVASLDGEILGKPTDRDDARRMLTALRGRRHQCLTGVHLWRTSDDEQAADVMTTELLMHQLTDQQIDEYLDTGLWQGKAGAFGLQDRMGWIELIEGSESNVVGLPLERLAELVSGLNTH